MERTPRRLGSSPVPRQMIVDALDEDDFVEGWGHFREGTLGEALEGLVRRIWPNMDARSLRATRAAEPTRFEARLQGRLDILGGGTR